MYILYVVQIYNNFVLMVVYMTLKARQRNETESPLIYFHRKKRLLRQDLNPQPPAFKAVAPSTEPPRQPSWLGSNHKLCKAKRLISPDKQGQLKLNI